MIKGLMDDLWLGFGVGNFPSLCYSCPRSSKYPQDQGRLTGQNRRISLSVEKLLIVAVTVPSSRVEEDPDDSMCFADEFLVLVFVTKASTFTSLGSPSNDVKKPSSLEPNGLMETGGLATSFPHCVPCLSKAVERKSVESFWKFADPLDDRWEGFVV